jgi:hypothetical protein
MTATRPCYRHARGVWMVSCAACNAWHMAAALASRDQVVSVTAAARTTDRGASPLPATRVAPPALPLAA